MSAERMNGYISRKPGVCGGKPCIDGLRLRVQDVYVAHELQGMPPDAICDAFPPVTLAQVHAALAYYYDHLEEIRAEVEADKAFAEQYRAQHPERVR